MKVLVTGANGFLGRHVVESLLERGHDVRVLVRPAAKLESLGWPETVEVFRADLRSSNDLESAFDGVEVLLHLAAAVTGGEDTQFAAAVVGTERLLSAMALTSCKRLVLASSYSVYDWSRIKKTLTASSPTEPAPDLYGRDGYAIAKSWQERVTRRFAEQHGWDLTVLRPGFIWGRDHADMGAVWMKVGGFHLIIGPLSHIPMTHVENCADLFALCASDPRARGQTFNVVDGEGPRIWSFARDYLRGTGEHSIRVPIPYFPTYNFVRLLSGTVFKGATKLPQILVPACFESRLKPLRFSYREAHDVLGWNPPLGYEQCLQRTFGPEPKGERPPAAPIRRGSTHAGAVSGLSPTSSPASH